MSGAPLTSSQPVSERFDSWKEIARYLGRDLRTVRRWEQDKGLPVHRVPGGERRAVFAYRAEIDAWLSDKSSVVDDFSQEEDEASHRPDGIPAAVLELSPSGRRQFAHRSKVAVAGAVVILAADDSYARRMAAQGKKSVSDAKPSGPTASSLDVRP